MMGSGSGWFGKLCCRVASLPGSGYKDNAKLARLSPKGFYGRAVVVAHPRFQPGVSGFFGDGVVLYGRQEPGELSIGHRTFLHSGTILEASEGGRIVIGDNTHIQPNCQLSAHKGSILIGSAVQLAPSCGLYPYNHGIEPGVNMRDQPITSNGDIVIGDDVWVGYGAIILEAVSIGDGAIVAAGSVVREDVAAGAIVAGVPARVVGQR